MHFQLDNKKHAERRTLFENGEMAVTLPTAALSPPFKALGVSLYARLLSQQTPHAFSAPSNSATVSPDRVSEGLL